LRLQDRTVTTQEVLVHKQLYERLQLLQQQASDAIPQYIVLRDRRFSTPTDQTTRDDHEKAREVERLYAAEKGKLRGLIREYNQLEAKLAGLEGRTARLFKLSLPPMAPKNLRVEKQEGSTVTLRWDPPDPDPLATAVKDDVQELFRQYGQEFPPPPSEKK